MRTKILEIADKLRYEDITTDEAKVLFEKLFDLNWKNVIEETPPNDVNLLAKSPDGIVYLCNWRQAYNIFDCQNKNDKSYDWQWKYI